MAEQPATLEELVHSVFYAARTGRRVVTLTTYSGLPETLPSNIRAIFGRASREAVMVNVQTEDDTDGPVTIQVNKTDIWYAQHDHEGTFQNMVNSISYIARTAR